MRSIIFFFITIVIVLCACLGLYATHFIHSPSGLMEEDTIIEIAPGTSFFSITETLKKSGVISSATLFRFYAKVKGAQNSFKAGEYLFSPAAAPVDILEKLSKGGVINRKVTIPEGFNLYQVAEVLEKKGLVSKSDFISAAFDKKLLKKLGIINQSAEGYLYPETYFFVKGMNVQRIITIMVDRLNRIYSNDFEKRAKEIGFSRDQIINLASIIEKETANPDERPLISAVFHNRLKQRIRLASDPTVIYGIKDFNGDITKKDLRTKTPYNTYRINGLPVGPIANPGIDSIRAALYPEDVDYVYFVSKNNGSHAFSTTLKQHNRYVWKYQKSRRRKK